MQISDKASSSTSIPNYDSKQLLLAANSVRVPTQPAEVIDAALAEDRAGRLGHWQVGVNRPIPWLHTGP